MSGRGCALFQECGVVSKTIGTPSYRCVAQWKVEWRKAAGDAYAEHNKRGIKRETGFRDAREQAGKCKHGCSGRKKRPERMGACKARFVGIHVAHEGGHRSDSYIEEPVEKAANVGGPSYEKAPWMRVARGKDDIVMLR